MKRVLTPNRRLFLLVVSCLEETEKTTPNDPFPILERMEYCSLKVLSGPRWYRYIQTFRNLGLISSHGIVLLRCPCPDVITSMHDKRDQITDSKNLVHNFLIIYFNDVTSSSRTGQNSQLRSRCRSRSNTESLCTAQDNGRCPCY